MRPVFTLEYWNLRSPSEMLVSVCVCVRVMMSTRGGGEGGELTRGKNADCMHVSCKTLSLSDCTTFNCATFIYILTWLQWERNFILGFRSTERGAWPS